LILTIYPVIRYSMLAKLTSKNRLTLPKGTPFPHTFWESPTIEELACSQEVRPMTDVRVLFGTWPGEEEDGFEEAIDELRHSDIEVGGRL